MFGFVFLFFSTDWRICVFCSFPLTRRPRTLSPPSPSPADPLCRPANGGSAREDEGEESADRRAGHACNTSQRKSLTPWAEAGKTVILFFFSPQLHPLPRPTPPSIPPPLHPWFLLSGSRTEPSRARPAEPIFVRKSAADSLRATGSNAAARLFVNEPSTSVLALSALVSRGQGPLAPS